MSSTKLLKKLKILEDLPGRCLSLGANEEELRVDSTRQRLSLRSQGRLLEMPFASVVTIELTAGLNLETQELPLSLCVTYQEGAERKSASLDFRLEALNLRAEALDLAFRISNATALQNEQGAAYREAQARSLAWYRVKRSDHLALSLELSPQKEAGSSHVPLLQSPADYQLDEVEQSLKIPTEVPPFSPKFFVSRDQCTEWSPGHRVTLQRASVAPEAREEAAASLVLQLGLGLIAVIGIGALALDGGPAGALFLLALGFYIPSSIYAMSRMISIHSSLRKVSEDGLASRRIFGAGFLWFQAGCVVTLGPWLTFEPVLEPIPMVVYSIIMATIFLSGLIYFIVGITSTPVGGVPQNLKDLPTQVERVVQLDWSSKQVTLREGKNVRCFHMQNIKEVLVEGHKIQRSADPSDALYSCKISLQLAAGKSLLTATESFVRDPKEPYQQALPLACALASSLGVSWTWRGYR